MNVIVANKQKNIIDNANIDAIKDFNGLFNVDDLISKFKNYFFSKLILDATSVVNFTSKEVLEKLSSAIGAERLVILLPEKPLPPKKFVDMLLELKIYNFSNKIDDIVIYIDKPNTYEEIVKKMQYDDFYVDNSIKEGDTYQEEKVSDNQSVDNGEQNELINEKEEIKQEEQVSNVNDNQFNNSYYIDESKFLNKKIVGFKNVTSHAGTTTIMFLLKKMLQNKFKKSVLALEVETDDFKYYQEEDMISVEKDKLKSSIANSDAEIILVDINNYTGEKDYFNDVVYLVEPSIIKLNKLMIDDRYAFRSLDGKKVILNQSFLSNSEASAFAKEADVEVFMNIPTLNDRVNNDQIAKLIHNLFM